MKDLLIQANEILMVAVETLITPEYRVKDVIEGRENELLNSIKKYGIKKPVVVNQFPGRENVVIDGCEVILACKDLGIVQVPVYFVKEDLESEKELHFRLNYQITSINESQINELLQEFHDEFIAKQSINNGLNDDITEHSLLNQVKTKPRLQMVTSKLNTEERIQFSRAKEFFNCQKDSHVLRQLLNFFDEYNRA